MDILGLLKNTGIIIASYLIGAIPFCFLIAKLHSGKDLRKIGEKNPGSVNLMLNVSKTLGIFGGFLDFLKGLLAFWVPYRVTGSLSVAVVAASGAVLGHNYSPYLGFGGGKGMATSIGVLFGAHPYSLIAFAVSGAIAIIALKNIIWTIVASIIGANVFLYFFAGSRAFLLLCLLLIAIVIPKYVVFTKKEVLNDLRINRKASLRDLFYEDKKYEGR
jgi:acyl phosphate:glycerol-3-phosphate acyltransferase